MMKKLIVIFAVLGVFAQTACTSKDSKNETEVAADFDASEMAALEGSDAGEDSSLMSTELPEEALGEAAPADSNPIVTTETTQTIAENNPVDQAATVESTEKSTISEMEPVAQQSTELLPPSEPVVEKPLEETPAYAEVSSQKPKQAKVDTSSDTPKAPKSSLQKIKSTPFQVGGFLANTVYISRPGDSLSSISQSVYGKDRVADLKKMNPSLKRRDVKAGEKVYYNSPNRPDDSSRMLTWFEDNGVAPEVYVAKSGDDLKKISKNLLGYADAWKEVWSTNDVESKDKLDEGTQIRYWASSPIPPPVVAANTTPQPEMAQLPPPPAMPEENAQLPPPPQPEEQMAANEIPPPPPPPAMDQMAPPPPPPQEVAQEAQPAEEAAPGVDEDMTLALTAVMIAAAGLAALIVVRRKRKHKESEQSLSTHVG